MHRAFNELRLRLDSGRAACIDYCLDIRFIFAYTVNLQRRTKLLLRRCNRVYSKVSIVFVAHFISVKVVKFLLLTYLEYENQCKSIYILKLDIIHAIFCILYIGYCMICTKEETRVAHFHSRTYFLL